MSADNSADQPFDTAVAVNQMRNGSITKEDRAKLAQVTGVSESNLARIYRTSVNFTKMEVSDERLIGGAQGMFSSEITTRADVRGLLNKAEKAGYEVSYITGQDGRFYPYFTRDGETTEGPSLALDERTERYVRRRLGAPRSETLPALRPQDERAVVARASDTAAMPLAAVTEQSAAVDAGQYTFVPPVTMTMDQPTIERLSGVVSAALEKKDPKIATAIEQFLQASGTSVVADGALSGAEAAAALNRIYGMSGKELTEPTMALIQALPAVANPGRER